MKIMEQTDCILCDPYECTCDFFSTNPIFSQQGISPPREFPDRNHLNQRMPLQECVQPPFSSSRQKVEDVLVFSVITILIRVIPKIKVTFLMQ